MHPPAILFASFALPLIALGAAGVAAGVPVLIHLLSRQRYQIVPWAAIRFLMAAQKRHRRRIDRWVLLALRMLALLLPLAAMCAATDWAERGWQWIKPGRLEAVSNAPRTHHVIVLDASLSMTATGDNGTRFDKALRQIEELIRGANPGDGFSILMLGNGSKAVIPGPADDPEEILPRLRALKPTHGTADYSAGLSLIADTLANAEKDYPRRQVTFFTDAQRSAWSTVLPKTDVPLPETWQKVLALADVGIIDVAGADVENVAVMNVSLADPLALVDSPTAVTATIQNFGKTDRTQVRVELLIGRPTPNGTELSPVLVEVLAIDTLPAGQQASVTFVLDKKSSRFQSPGLHAIQVKLADADELPTDDQRTLVLQVRESLPALLVNGKGSSDPAKRASDYLQTALDPGKQKLPDNPARPRTVSLTEFADAELSDLSAVDCVFLCDVPAPSAAQIARLEAHLKRGGGVVIGLGPNAANNLDWYNQLLFNGGNGLLPGKLTGVVKSKSPELADFRLAADDASFRQDPLAAFRTDNARGGLLAVPFKQYVRMDAPADGRARRIVSFVPAKADVLKPGEEPVKSDPAIVEWARHRGRVVVYCSSFNQDWTDWPVLPSFLPMAHELLRFAATSPDRHTLRVGDAIEELLPVARIGSKVVITGPQELSTSAVVQAGDETGLLRFGETNLSGLYRLGGAGDTATVFAVNVPETTRGGGSESDLARVDYSKLKDIGSKVQIAASPSELAFETVEGGLVVMAPRPHGPSIARWVLSAVLLLLVAEIAYAWWIGPSRAIAAGVAQASQPQHKSGTLFRLLELGLGMAALGVAIAFLAIVIHAELSGRPLGFLPDDTRTLIEGSLGVPTAGPGEGTKWKVETATAYLHSFRHDRRLIAGLMLLAIATIATFYWLERRTSGKLRRVVLPALLRIAAVLLLGFILLPQLRLAFQRDRWPDVVILIDTSASMSRIDPYEDPAVRAKAAELTLAADVPEAHRLQFAQMLLNGKKTAWLNKLVADKQVKVHLYAIDEQARLLATLDRAADLETGRKAVADLKPTGPSSQLGDGLKAVLGAFEGRPPFAVIVLSDGVTTDGESLSKAAERVGGSMGRKRVPIYTVGLGDRYDPPDLILSDLKSDDVVRMGDELILEARLTVRGPNPPKSVPVILYERQGEKLVERGRQTVTLDPAGKPVPVRIAHTPAEIGEKTFVLDTPPLPNEAETGNNRLERAVLVTDTKKLKVLLIDGYPRYEFRFLKTLFERETETEKGGRSTDLDVLFLDASAGHWQLDKSTERLRGVVPTKTQLFEYDAVIFGDVNPALLPKANQFLTDLAEFVKVKGGGLIFIAGEQSTPHKLFETPLGELLPIAPTETASKTGGPSPTPENAPIKEDYKPKLTALGRSHPLFRFTSDEAENDRIWELLRGFYWHSGGYRKKPAAEVLATHPVKSAEGEPNALHPIALQQFVGAGRVMFLGFDETWRWRFRLTEERFDQFWSQAVRTVARSKVSRIELKTDKPTTYRRGEPIGLTVRFPDDAPAPAVDAVVKVRVERKPIRLPGQSGRVGDAETQTVRLTKMPGTRATFTTVLTRTPEGEYAFQLTEGSPTKQANNPRAEAKVLPPQGELDQLSMNRADLEETAKKSGGEFFTLATAEELMAKLVVNDRDRVQLNQPCPPLSIWNHAALFALWVLLLAGEWWLRRRERLV